MSASARRTLWALCIALLSPPLDAVVISHLPDCRSCSEVADIGESQAMEASLNAGLAAAAYAMGAHTTGFFEIDDSQLALEALGGTLIEQAGVVVPSGKHPFSALGDGDPAGIACQDCGDTDAVAQASASGVRIGFGIPFAAIVVMILIAAAVGLFYIVRYIRSLEAEESYLRERWGVRGRMD